MTEAFRVAYYGTWLVGEAKRLLFVRLEISVHSFGGCLQLQMACQVADAPAT